MGFYETASTTGETVAAILEDSMTRFGLNIDSDKLRGQGYDGASNMSGKFIGVQALMKKKHPRAMYIHCFNHCLNLVLQDAAKPNCWIADTLGLVHGVFVFMKESGKREGILQSFLEETASLKPIAQTRWTVRFKSLKAFETQYAALLLALKEIAKDKKIATAAATAAGYAHQMRKMEVFFGVILAKDLFEMTDKVATSLQCPETTLFEAKGQIETLSNALLDMKSDDTFNIAWRRATTFAEQSGLEMPTLPRHRNPPLRFRNNPGVF